MNPVTLQQAAVLSPNKVIVPASVSHIPIQDNPILLVLAAGKGTRFGTEPKCIQPVAGTPLTSHTINSFRNISPEPAICVVGYRQEDVRKALGENNWYIVSSDPTGGTAYAVWESFSLANLQEENPLLVISMGDRVIPSAVFDRILAVHYGTSTEPELTFLTAIYESPLNNGRGRIIRDKQGCVERITEQKDIDNEPDAKLREALQAVTECNCPLYVIRAGKLKPLLASLTNANAQEQYYLTDIIEAIRARGGEIRTATVTPDDPSYDILSSDVTRADDLALLEGLVAAPNRKQSISCPPVDAAADAISKGRSPGQVRSIARQLQELYESGSGFAPDQPLAVGIAGGRLRLAFMHPDMERFYGPAWQMPVGAIDECGDDQITVITQISGDNRLHMQPLNNLYKENTESIPCDQEFFYPSQDVTDMAAYEKFGTQLSEKLLLSMGYFSNGELEARRRNGIPLPPSSLWVSSNMRRPFTLAANAIASFRTLHNGSVGKLVQQSLGKKNFNGLRIAAAGNIPQGGFSSSSALTVAVKNALNSLYGFNLPPDLLVHLACQAEYGTGVRAGSLDQATEQKGEYGIGALISSNPRDNYTVLGTFQIPQDRYVILYPYSVARDREAWKWSGGYYSSGAGNIDDSNSVLTAGELRKMTGKAAAIAALLVDLPDETDFFKVVEKDLLQTGSLSITSRTWVTDILKTLPLCINRDELKKQVTSHIGNETEAQKTLSNLFSSDWHNPVLPVRGCIGDINYEPGVPLRSMVGYLFAEVVRNFRLLYHQDEWIRCVTLSQRGDCCFTINPDMLPNKEALLCKQPWEVGISGPELLEAWLHRVHAIPADFNQGLRDDDLAAGPVDFLSISGGNFFRGLALIDLAEAMLKRAFGNDAVAVRVNAAGQGDYFQVHVDSHLAEPEEVKQFVRQAFYSRFNLSPEREFVELHPGGGACGAYLPRADLLTQLVRRLRMRSHHA